MAPQAFGRAVLTGLGSFAVLLMALAVYVLAESLATTRVREIGIRAALGATSGEIGAMLFGQLRVWSAPASRWGALEPGRERRCFARCCLRFSRSMP